MTIDSEECKTRLQEDNVTRCLNVLFVIDGFYPSFGGAEKQAELLINTLHSQEYNVRVITPYMDKKQPLTEVMNGVLVERIAYPRIKILGAFILVLRVAFKLIKERKKIDAIHIHMVKNLAAVIGLIKPFLRAKVIAKISGAWEFNGGVLDPSLNSKLSNKVMNYLIKRIDYYQAISGFTVEQLKLAGYLESKIAFIPNAIDTSRFFVDRNKQCSDGCLYAIYTGRLEYIKGVDVLLDAWSKVLDCVEGKKIKLLIAGSGRELLNLKEVVREKNIEAAVNFLGLIQDVPNILSKSHIYIQPSRQEGLSNSVLEAMAAGLPIVATRVSGNEDIVSNGNNGFLVKSESPLELSEAIIKLINNEEQRIAFGKKSNEIIMNGFQLPVILKKLSQAYNGEL